jgi:hypothetical protein
MRRLHLEHFGTEHPKQPGRKCGSDALAALDYLHSGKHPVSLTLRRDFPGMVVKNKVLAVPENVASNFRLSDVTVHVQLDHPVNVPSPCRRGLGGPLKAEVKRHYSAKNALEAFKLKLPN